MSIIKLIFKSIAYHWRSLLAVGLGVVIGTAVLTGAFIVGDSIRNSLKQITFNKLGKVQYAMEVRGRFFRSEIEQELSEKLGTDAAALLQLKGMCLKDGGNEQANNVQVFCISPAFWSFSQEPPENIQLAEDEACINEILAQKLNISVGEDIIVRIQKTGLLPSDAPFSNIHLDNLVVLRFTVKEILQAEQMGHFSLRITQTTLPSLFLSLPFVQEKLTLEGKANTLLIAGRQDITLSLEEVQSVLKDVWTLEDAGIHLRKVPSSGSVDLISDEVFIKKRVYEILKEDSEKTGSDIKGIFTYFVNEFSSPGGSAPYSFVSTHNVLPLSPEMEDDEIIINDWLAGDLMVFAGDTIQLSYYRLDENNKLIEETKPFVVRTIIPLEDREEFRLLVPSFPGLSEVSNCRDWKPGVSIDLKKIRKRDEEYWNEYRGTPKAFVTLKTAQSLWANLYGSYTSIRFPDEEENIKKVEAILLNELTPQEMGLVFRDMYEEGLKAANQAVDFGQLFIGLSFFLIASSFILVNLLFVFYFEQRKKETAILKALGYPDKTVFYLFLAESTLLIVVCTATGLLAGIGYNHLLLLGLKTLWQDVVGTPELHLYINPASLLTACLSCAFIAFITIFITLRKQMKRDIVPLMVSSFLNFFPQDGPKRIKNLKANAAVVLLLLLAVLSIFYFQGKLPHEIKILLFFLAGVLLLLFFIFLFRFILILSGSTGKLEKGSLLLFGLRNASRRVGRSLAVIGLMACGIFLVSSVGLNQKDVGLGAGENSSGTGGYDLYCETSIPLQEKSDEFKNLQDETALEASGFVFFKLFEGDEASCLNLNYVERPPLLGFDPVSFSSRKSFSFATVLDELEGEDVWLALDREIDENIIPGIADQTAITWGLGKSVGDTIEFLDQEGNEFKIKLIAGLENSVFQGNILISEKLFRKRFPNIGGYHIFLVDTNQKEKESIKQFLTASFRDYGLTVTSTVNRLNDFYTVERTYLSVFLLLGGLGLVLGTAGLAVVVRRNMTERQSETAILKVLGFSKRFLTGMFLSEHLFLLTAGIVSGLSSSFAAVLPVLQAPLTKIPLGFLFSLVLLILLLGLAWIYFSVKMVLKREPLPVLRLE
jgi:putative ABC transport system permease protein